MSTSETENELSECVVNLPSVLDITSAKQLYEDLNRASHAQKLIIHAEKVERITTPAIQLLLVAEKSLKALDGTFVIQSPSEVVQNAFSDLGLDSQLKQWSGA